MGTGVRSDTCLPPNLPPGLTSLSVLSVTLPWVEFLNKARVPVSPGPFRGSSLRLESPLGQVFRKVSRPETQVGLKENGGENRALVHTRVRRTFSCPG